jgi:hypothetical protein
VNHRGPSRDGLVGGPSHPLALVALIVLVVNDHLGKGIGPGWLTGKLSDLAFLVVAPVALAAALAHLGLAPRRASRAALAAVGLGFTLLQLWPPLGDTWVALVGGSHVADAADLLALPALALAPWCWRRARPLPLALPAAALACVATSFGTIPEYRFPEDQDPAWDPHTALWIRFVDYVDEDAPAWRDRITLLDAGGAAVPFVLGGDWQVLAICPIGGLEPDADYTWTVTEDPGTSGHHWPTPRTPLTGTWSFHTADAAAAPAILDDAGCDAAAAALSEVYIENTTDRVVSDTGGSSVDTDSGAAP